MISGHRRRSGQNASTEQAGSVDTLQATSQHIDFLLIGGGIASAFAAETLRAEGAAGSVLILSQESVRPYHRPPLSKKMLLADIEERIFIHSEKFYRDKAIDLQLDTTVVSVDTENRTVATAKGEQIHYGKLLIATGANPKRLLIPGADLSGIHTLRNVNDASAIRSDTARTRHAVILGGSFLGMETAMTLVELGIDVTIVEEGPRLLPYIESTALSDYFQTYVESRGVTVLLNDRAAAFHGSECVEGVETVSGRKLRCDLAIVSIGVEPASDFLRGSNIALKDGRIVVDALLNTNVPEIFAAGDVVAFYDPVFASRRHIEHWDNAGKQGRLAARNMIGRRLPYDEVSYFFCEIGDIGFNMLGWPRETQDRISRGAIESKSFALFYLRNDIPRALLSMGRPVDETRRIESMIRHRFNIGSVRDRLKDPTFKLDHTPTQTALVLQGGGALGAFECGVVKALEEMEIFPDIVAGVSIGAFNGAIIASHPRDAASALDAFWSELSVLTPDVPFAGGEQALSALQILTLGVPNFFQPRWMQPFAALNGPPFNWTSFYDTAPVKQLLAKYVDFAALKRSPVRLLLSAVNVATAELDLFDSYVDDLTPDHILASGSLPPGFPWTNIDGKAYWDGGIVSNSPLDILIERCGPDGKRVFVVDLFAGDSPLPANMMEVLLRREEIVYTESIRSDLRHRETIAAYRKLVGHLVSRLDPAEAAKVRNIPRYIQLMGDEGATTITRFARKKQESPSSDYDFSLKNIRKLQAAGYAAVQEAHAEPGLHDDRRE
ncbi:pyridine nucleotide-disulfide oxidoreductase [Altericroceibacterium spongiae]|uniref:Pyridine nucleotide-disulfide oxidoreductase n=1 Tax=Altericroceibacterium spongiae TaxID=2320269 RepID=A0A420ERL0_9SPHN|nr:FAD-dependent oxidoreductase [Altericroceibacterium spongiae]RKF23334.1 pyridine nucleotide-disulfide oxidoreductase [Altericroceibacterium spongiae]